MKVSPQSQAARELRFIIIADVVLVAMSLLVKSTCKILLTFTQTEGAFQVLNVYLIELNQPAVRHKCEIKQNDICAALLERY